MRERGIVICCSECNWMGIRNHYSTFPKHCPDCHSLGDECFLILAYTDIGTVIVHHQQKWTRKNWVIDASCEFVPLPIDDILRNELRRKRQKI